jgi:hypothetical protein
MSPEKILDCCIIAFPFREKYGRGRERGPGKKSGEINGG